MGKEKCLAFTSWLYKVIEKQIYINYPIDAGDRARLQ